MKRYFLIYALFFLGIGAVKAQYKDMHDFNGSSGSTPFCDVTVSLGKLYGMTSAGGAHNDGCIFSLDTNGISYTDILDFNGTNGSLPQGNVTVSGNVLFGMASEGGAHNYGCIFSVNTNGSNYKEIFDFGGPNGAYPTGSLILNGKVLYGMVEQGAAHNYGRIFSIDTNGSNYKDLFDFSGTNGASPTGALTLSGNKLYGMTSAAYLSTSNGNLFSIDTNGGNYKDLLEFNGTNGANPYGSLILSGKKLYGMTSAYNTPNAGNIFSIDTNGGGYKDLLDFNGTNGDDPHGSLVLSGRRLYGMTTEYYNSSNYGNIFSIDTSGSSYVDMFDFDGMNGTTPPGSLALAGDVFYGMSPGAGANNDGLVFSFRDKSLGIGEIVSNTGVVNLYPNPNNGEFTIQLPVVSHQLSVQVYNTLGEMVYQTKITQGASHISLPNPVPGVYLYRITSTEGTIKESRRFIVE